MGTPSLPDISIIVDRISPFLLDTAARSVVVLALAGTTALFMRRASAAARHWVWLLGFAGLILMPILSMILPDWRVLPRIDMERATIVQEISENRQQATLRSDLPVINEREPVPASKAIAAAAPSQGGGRMSAGQWIASWSWTAWVAFVWLAGGLLAMGHLLLGYLSLWSLQRRCAKIEDGKLADLLEQLRAKLQVRREVELLSSPVRTMPMTWGLWRSRLLLPDQACSWPHEQCRAVLLHELGHVRRYDCLTQLFAQIVCALYWFNPMAWFAWRRMQVERERACDDLVLSTGAKPSAYAEHLLRSASSAPTLRFVGAAALAMARPSTLEERLTTILDSNRNRGTLTTRGMIATVLLLAAALVPVAVLSAQEVQIAQPRPQPGAAPSTAPSTTAPSAQTIGRGRGRVGGLTGGRSGGFGGGGGGFGASGGFADSAQSVRPVSTDGPTCKLDAIIYDVRLPANQIGRLDMDALNRASATAESFEKALADLGTAQPLFRASQSVRLAGDSITIGSTTPYITNSQISASGQVMNSVAYSNTGALFNVAGKAGVSGNIELDMNVEVSALSEGGTEISPGVKAPMFRRVTMSHKGTVEAGKPFVVLSVDASAVDAAGKAVAYIARITMGAPQSSN